MTLVLRICVHLLLSAFICVPVLLLPIPDVHEAALDGGGRRHLWADQVRPAALALTTFEVPVGSRRAALAGLEDVRVHAQAHRAARLAPVKTRRLEDLVQALVLGL